MARPAFSLRAPGFVVFSSRIACSPHSHKDIVARHGFNSLMTTVTSNGDTCTSRDAYPATGSAVPYLVLKKASPPLALLPLPLKIKMKFRWALICLPDMSGISLPRLSLLLARFTELHFRRWNFTLDRELIVLTEHSERVQLTRARIASFTFHFLSYLFRSRVKSSFYVLLTCRKFLL